MIDNFFPHGGCIPSGERAVDFQVEFGSRRADGDILRKFASVRGVFTHLARPQEEVLSTFRGAFVAVFGTPRTELAVVLGTS